MSEFRLSGGCQCGAVRYELRGPAQEVNHCHCSICRRLHGAMFASFAMLRPGDFVLLKGADVITRYQSSPGCGRFFCSRCGSQIYSDVDQLPKIRFVAVGTLDEGAHPGHPAGTEHHVYVGSKVPWWKITDGLPQYEEHKRK